MTLYTVSTAESRLFIEARSTLHPIHGTAAGFTGSAEARVVNERIDLRTAPRARLELPVPAVTSGSALRDFEMLRVVEARRFPTITVELRSVTRRPVRDTYRLAVDLSFHGVTRLLNVDATATLDGGRAVLECAFRLDVRSFGVKPPRIPGMSLKPEIDVRAHIVFQREDVGV